MMVTAAKTPTADTYEITAVILVRQTERFRSYLLSRHLRFRENRSIPMHLDTLC